MDRIVVTKRCYDLLKKYVDLTQTQPNHYKTFNERILELLDAELDISGFRLVLGIMRLYITDLEYTSEHRHVFLEDRTTDFLTLYCFNNDYRNFNEGLYNLIEKAINRITIKNLKQEYEEVTH